MSMMTVPSLAPGARTLPGELRGNARGWNRLHSNLAPLTEGPDPRIALSGVGDWYDESGIPMATPVYGAPPPGGGTDWGSIIGAGTTSLEHILAITQGGSVTNSGIYGSQQTGNIAAAQVPYGSLNVSTAGISGILSSPIVLAGLALVAFMVISKK